ncbi:MAG: exosortase/archaeosortase family protein [Bacteroidia bacterium]|nr:exosortase/archaeosortase family protein [Bacteroidia bacterium]
MINNIKVYFKQILERFYFLKGPVYFVIILLLTHFAWRYSFEEDIDLSGNPLLFLWGIDVTNFFNAFSMALTKSVYILLHDILGVDVGMLGNTIFSKDSHMVINVVWSCSGIKQMFVFFCIIVFYPGSILRKLWYVPSGLIVIALLNIIRIAMIAYGTKINGAWFDQLHEISKYVFYAIIFLMWVLWEEKIRKNESHA